MKTFAIALLCASVSASNYAPWAQKRALDLRHSSHRDVKRARGFTLDATQDQNIAQSQTRQNRVLDTITGSQIVYDDVPETRIRRNLVTRQENRPQQVDRTDYTTERVAGKKNVTRYDIVDEEYDGVDSVFQVGQKDVPIVTSEVAYDEVTTTRDNYLTIAKLCPIKAYKDVKVDYIENIEKTKLVEVADFEEVWETRDVTTLVEETYTDYIKKQITVCDSSSDDDYSSSSYGHGWASSSSDDCKIIWKSVPVQKSRQVPVVTQEQFVNKRPVTRIVTENYTEQVPRSKIVQESTTDYESCEELVNYPTTTTNLVPRTVLINGTKQVDVSSIKNTAVKRTRPISVARDELQDNYSVAAVRNDSSYIRDNIIQVQSLEDEEIVDIRKVGREEETSRQASRYVDYQADLSYSTPFQAVSDNTQYVIRQETDRHYHAAPVLGEVEGAKTYDTSPAAPVYGYSHGASRYGRRAGAGKYGYKW